MSPSPPYNVIQYECTHPLALSLSFLGQIYPAAQCCDGQCCDSVSAKSRRVWCSACAVLRWGMLSCGVRKARCAKLLSALAFHCRTSHRMA
eukprot:2029999-Rhodomonas_salina.1